MYLTALAIASVLTAIQVPVHEGPESPKQEASTAEAIAPLAGLFKMKERLLGGEWIVDEHFFRKTIQRFVPAPGDGLGFYLETRDKDDLTKPLPELNVVFFEPSSNTVRGIAIADRGAFSNSTFVWQGDMLIRKYQYHLSDGSMLDGVLSETTMDLESHWSFEGRSAYKWELFQETPSGMSSVLETSFRHEETLTELPTTQADPQEASKPLEFLAPLQGDKAAKSDWNWKAAWRVKGMGLWVQRTVPHPLFGRDESAPRLLSIEGFYYWNPLKKQAKFIGFSSTGELIQGSTALNPRQQIESTYTVESSAPIDPENRRVVPVLGEQIQVQADGKLKMTWVLVGPDGKPKIIEANME